MAIRSDEAQPIRDDLLERLDEAAGDGVDMGRFALAARDAYWDEVRSLIGGESPGPGYEDFELWQRHLVSSDGRFPKDIRRALREQILNASVPQIGAYELYAEDVDTAAYDDEPPWAAIGYVELLFRRRRIKAIRVREDGSADTLHQGSASDEDAVERVSREGWREAFEAMVPLVATRHLYAAQSASIWEPWVRKPTSPGDLAAALERVYTDATLTDDQGRALGRLVGPVAVARVLLDPDFDRQFWAGEWLNDFIAQAPSEAVAERLIAKHAPELYDGSGGW